VLLSLGFRDYSLGVDNTKIDVRETGWEVADWIHLAQGRDQWQVLANTEMNLRVP
jgi:hypothetical protein